MILGTIQPMIPGWTGMYLGLLSFFSRIGHMFPDTAEKSNHVGFLHNAQRRSHRNKEGENGGLFLSTSVAAAVILILVVFSMSCGCVEMGEVSGSQNALQQDPAPHPHDTPSHKSATQASSTGSAQMGGLHTVSVPDQSISGASKGVATYTDPIPPSIAYTVMRRDLDQTADFFPRPSMYPVVPFFQGTYGLSWNNIAILAQPSSLPFVIDFIVKADSENPYDARVLLTVRDNATHEVIAEEGYNGEYSSESEKRIVIREDGEYHINLYGYRATVDLSLKEGIPDGQVVVPETSIPESVHSAPTSGKDDPGASPVAPGAEILNEKGEALLIEGDYPGALGYFDQAIAVDTGYMPARVNRGIVLLSLGKAPEALLSFEIVIDRKPGNAQAWIYRGDALTSLGRQDEARESYQQAGKIEPGNSLVQERLTRMKERDSQDELTEIFQISFGVVLGLITLSAITGFILLKKREKKESSLHPVHTAHASSSPVRLFTELFDRILKVRKPKALDTAPTGQDSGHSGIKRSVKGTLLTGLLSLFHRKTPEENLHIPAPDGISPPPFGNPGLLDPCESGRRSTNGNTICSSTENRTQIITGFDRVLAGSGIDSSGFRGLSHYAMGDYEAAFEAFTEYNQIDRDNPEIFARQALSLLKLGRMEDALQVFETALCDGKGTFEIRKIQCNILEQMGRWEDTLRACDEALSLNPRSVKTCSMRARALYHLNRNQEALQSCEYALKIDPASAELLQQKTLLLADSVEVSDKGVFFEPASNEGKDMSGTGKGGWLS